MLDLTGMRSTSERLVTRYAPSPTGYLHLGHVLNAIHVWGIASAVGAVVLLRIEDHDRIRSKPVYERAILEDLDWLGFSADTASPAIRQSDRYDLYAAARERLRARHHVYTCLCSRRSVGGERYPGTCRTMNLDDSQSLALRVEIPNGAENFDDVLAGPQCQRPVEQCGDLLIRDRDGHWTYQFAVTVDDMLQGITLVIRGMDLLESTGRQITLGRMLGRNLPLRFAHHPLLLGPTGQKLSKSDGAAGIRELRRAGLTAPQVIGRAAALAGLMPPGEEVTAAEVGRFWDRI